MNWIKYLAQFYTGYLYCGAFIAGCAVGGFVLHKIYESKNARDFKIAVAMERDSVVIANNADALMVKMQAEQLAKADHDKKQLQKELSKMGKCVVPDPVVGLLNNATVPATARPAAIDPTVKAAKTDCADVIESASNNYQLVCIPNAQSLDACRNFYIELQEKYNRRGWLTR